MFGILNANAIMINITNVDIINDFSNIKQDLFKIGYATFLSDLTNQELA